MKHGTSSIALLVIAFLSVSAAPIEETLPAFEKEPLERVPLLVRDDDLSIRDDTEVTSETESWEYGAPEETIESPAQNTELEAVAGEPSQFDERAVLPHACDACVRPVPHQARSPHHRARLCVPAPAAPLPGTTIVGVPAPVVPRPTTTTVVGVAPAAPRPTTTTILGAPAPVAPRPMTTTIVMPAGAPAVTTVVGVPPAVPPMPTTTLVVTTPAPAPLEPRPIPVPVPVPAPAPAPAPVPVPVPVAVPGHHGDDDATKAVPKVVERMPLIKLD